MFYENPCDRRTAWDSGYIHTHVTRAQSNVNFQVCYQSLLYRSSRGESIASPYFYLHHRPIDTNKTTQLTKHKYTYICVYVCVFHKLTGTPSWRSSSTVSVWPPSTAQWSADIPTNCGGQQALITILNYVLTRPCILKPPIVVHTRMVSCRPRRSCAVY